MGNRNLYFNNYRAFRKLMALLLIALTFFSCVDELKKYSPDDFQKRRNGLYYFKNSQDLFTGTVVVDNEIQTLTYRIEKGMLNGDYIKKWGNGQIYGKFYYKDGFLTGETALYSFDGDLRLEGQFENGQRVGKWKIYLYKRDTLYFHFTTNNDFIVNGKFKAPGRVEQYVDVPVDYTFKEGVVVKGLDPYGQSEVGKTEGDFLKFFRGYYVFGLNEVKYLGKSEWNELLVIPYF